VEPVVPPPEPRHIVAQQMLALCLQEHQVGEELWPQWWGGLGPFGKPAAPMVRHLVEQGYLDRDGGMLFIGPEAERRFGHRHFMNLTAVFTAAPEFTVLYGRSEIGTTDPDLLTEEVTGPRRLRGARSMATERGGRGIGRRDVGVRGGGAGRRRDDGRARVLAAEAAAHH